MNSFQSITIEGYRRLYNVQIDMHERLLTVMIGANGVGKTSLLEIFSLLAASANAQLGTKISELGGLGDIMTRDRAKSITISLSMSVPDYAPLDYRLEVAPKGLAYEIALETLTQQNDRYASEPFKHIDSRGLDVKYFNTEDQKLLRPNWDHNPLETSLAQVPKMYQEPENF